MVDRTQAERYSPYQFDVAAIVGLDMLKGAWFVDQIPELQDPELQRFLPEIILRIYLAYGSGKLLTKMDLARLAGAGHTKTLAKYLDWACEVDLVRYAASSKDARKMLIVPTDKLLDAALAQLGSFADKLRFAIHALLGNQLPSNGSPMLSAKEDPNDLTNSYMRELIEGRKIMIDGDHKDWNSTRYCSNLLEVAEETIEHAPGNLRAHINRGVALYMFKRYHEAISELDGALAIEPKSFAALLQRARAYQKTRRHKEAIVDLDAAIEGYFGKARAELFFDRGRSNFYLGLHKSGNSDFKRAIEADEYFLEVIEAFKRLRRNPSDWMAYSIVRQQVGNFEAESGIAQPALRRAK